MGKHGNLLACGDTERARELCANTDEHRPAKPPPFFIIEGLPPGIPVLRRTTIQVQLGSDTLYGIALHDLLTSSGRFRYRSGSELREKFHLPPDGRICLLASVGESPLEEFWTRSVADDVWRRLGRYDFEFVTGFSFSIYERQSRNGQLVNGYRNLASVEMLADAGLPVIPIVCEVVEEDLRWAADWIEEHPTIRVVAGLAQGWKGDHAFDRFLRRMRHLREFVSRPLHFLIIGCAVPARIERLFRELGLVTVTTAHFTHSAMGGMGWDPERQTHVKVPKSAASREDLLLAGLAEFMAICEGYAREVA